MTDIWGVHLYATDGVILWQGEAEKQDLPSNCLPSGSTLHTYIRTRPNKSMKVCEIGRAEVIKNHIIYAVVNLTNTKNHSLVGGTFGTFGFSVDEGDLLVRAAVKADCCCGCWKTYGKDSKLHADWCDVK